MLICFHWILDKNTHMLLCHLARQTSLFQPFLNSPFLIPPCTSDQPRKSRPTLCRCCSDRRKYLRLIFAINTHEGSAQSPHLYPSLHLTFVFSFLPRTIAKETAPFPFGFLLLDHTVTPPCILLLDIDNPHTFPFVNCSEQETAPRLLRLRSQTNPTSLARNCPNTIIILVLSHCREVTNPAAP